MDQSNTEYPTYESVGYLIRDLHRAINKVLAIKIAPSNLTTAQWFFLRALWEKDGISQKELSKAVGLTEPTTVAALKVLERNGIVQRKRDTQDTRKVIVRLARKGRLLKKRLFPVAREINELMLVKRSQKEIKQLKKTLRELTVRMEEEANGSGG